MRILAMLMLTCAIAAADDGAGPRAALLMFDKSVGPGETEKALACYHAASTRERALAQQLAEMDGALSLLQTRASARFGADVAQGMVRLLGGKTAADIDKARITVSDDQAKVLFEGDPAPMEMIRINGQWKLSVRAVIRQTGPDLKSLRRSLAELAGVARQSAKDIETRQASAEKISQTLAQAMRRAFPPDQAHHER